MTDTIGQTEDSDEVMLNALLAEAALPADSADRVRAAFHCQLDHEVLSESEWDAFLTAMAMATRNSERDAMERELRGGGVGYNEWGQLVEGLPGGGERVIEEAKGIWPD